VEVVVELGLGTDVRVEVAVRERASVGASVGTAATGAVVAVGPHAANTSKAHQTACVSFPNAGLTISFPSLPTGCLPLDRSHALPLRRPKHNLVEVV
jgi:hypothetical protein